MNTHMSILGRAGLAGLQALLSCVSHLLEPHLESRACQSSSSRRLVEEGRRSSGRFGANKSPSFDTVDQHIIG